MPTWVDRFKYAAAERVKRSPYAWSVVFNHIHRLPFLLPHERSYHGIRMLGLDPTRLILDVGANNGLSALGFRALGLKNPILSIEADPRHEKALNRVARRIPEFEFRILGAGDSRGEQVLHTPVYRGTPIHTLASSDMEYARMAARRDFSLRTCQELEFKETRIQVVPLDELELNPALIKIDVEGMDLLVLKGLERTIRRARPVLLVEFTPPSFDPIFDLLTGRGFQARVYDDETGALRAYDPAREVADWGRQGLQINVYFV